MKISEYFYFCLGVFSAAFCMHFNLMPFDALLFTSSVIIVANILHQFLNKKIKELEERFTKFNRKK